MTKQKLGIAVVGLGGAVGTTMVAGIELLKKGLIGTEGLPLAGFDKVGLADYQDIVFAGWDLFGEHLAKAAEEHDVLSYKQFVAVQDDFKTIKPWLAAGNKAFLANVDGENKLSARSHRDTIDALQNNLREFKKSCDSVVVINLASTEKLAAE